MPPDLDSLRQRIAAIDREILRLGAERLGLAAKIGAEKRKAGLAVRSYETEAEVLGRFRAEAELLGLDGRFAETIAATLISEAVRHQEEGHAAGAQEPERARVLIVGGAGKMGEWFVRFFAGQGHDVAIFDPAPASVLPDVPRVSLAAARDADVVLLAMPLSQGPDVLAEVLGYGPTGLVLDISSLKSHLVEILRAAADSGVRVASLHPLYGPSVRTLAGRIMAVCDCGHAEATEQAAALFKDTALTVTRIPVERHDEYMQFVLGFSHLMSVLFFTTLVQSGYAYPDLAAMASTTFWKQARTASELARENARMYYEIQRLNRHSPELYQRVRESLAEVEAAALGNAPERFVELMEAGRAWFPPTLPTELG